MLKPGTFWAKKSFPNYICIAACAFSIWKKLSLSCSGCLWTHSLALDDSELQFSISTDQVLELQAGEIMSTPFNISIRIKHCIVVCYIKNIKFLKHILFFIVKILKILSTNFEFWVLYHIVYSHYCAIVHLSSYSCLIAAWYSVISLSLSLYLSYLLRL